MTTTTKSTKRHTPAAELLEFAQQKAKTAKNWIELHNAIYGIEGRFAQLFPDQSSRTAFAKTSEYARVSELIRDIGDDKTKDLDDYASGKFVLRLPESMHAALVAEAKAEGVSLNQLCVAKLAMQLRAVVRK